LIYGAAFRNRQKSNVIGPVEIQNQKIATRSHLGLVQWLRNAFCYDCSVNLITYSTQYDEALRRWYRPSQAIFLQSPMRTPIDLYRFAIQSVDLNEDYDFLLFLRTDIALKEYFTSTFRPHHDKVMVSFPCCNGEGQSWWCVGDMLGFIPRSLFFLRESGFYFYHNVFFQLRDLGLAHRLDAYVNSHHRPQTGAGWNPLYYLPARPFNKKIDRPFMRDMQSQQDYQYDPKILYDVEAIDRRILTTPSNLEL
jgi:hypothetical protein